MARFISFVGKHPSDSFLGTFHEWPTAHLARLRDRDGKDDPKFCAEFRKSVDEEIAHPKFYHWSEHSIGIFAYGSLHFPDVVVRRLCGALLDDFREWRRRSIEALSTKDDFWLALGLRMQAVLVQNRVTDQWLSTAEPFP